MSKIVPASDIGVPVPTTAPPSTDSLVCYYGAAGFTAAYDQAARVVIGTVGTLTQKTVNGVSYYDVPVAKVLPANTGSGSYGFVFTLMDSAGNESDFSPPVTESIDATVPPALGQPIILG